MDTRDKKPPEILIAQELQVGDIFTKVADSSSRGGSKPRVITGVREWSYTSPPIFTTAPYPITDDQKRDSKDLDTDTEGMFIKHGELPLTEEIELTALPKASATPNNILQFPTRQR